MNIPVKNNIAEGEDKFRNLILQAPVLITTFHGPSFIIETINKIALEIWDKSYDQVANKPLFEVSPELEEGLKSILQNIYNTGEPFTASEIPVQLRRNGKLDAAYFTSVYQPLVDLDNKIYGIILIGTEVTDSVNARKQIEEREKAMQKMASHLKLATNAANVGTWSLNLQTQKLDWSDLHKRMWGYDEHCADLTYEDWHTIILLEDKQKAFEKVEEARVNKTIYNVEYRILRADNGAIHYINSFGKYYYNSKGEAETLNGISIDITERKKFEDGVRESEEKIRRFILQAPVAMCLYRGPKYIIEIVNEELLTIWGKTLESVINMSVIEALPQARDQGFEALLDKVYTTGEKFAAFGIPIIFTRSGKPKTIYVNLVYQAYRDADGVISGIVEVVSDVTEQVEANKQNELHEKQFNTFADSIQNLAWIANSEGWIYWYNQRWYDFTGTTLDEMQGWGWEKVHHPDHVESVVNFVKEAWKKDEAFELTFPLRRHDGVYHWFLTRAYPVKDANGNIERWIGTNTDVTEQKSFVEELEAKVKERTSELQIQNETFKSAEIIAKFGSYKWNITVGSLEYSDNLFRLLDCEPQEFVPTFEKFLSFIHPDDLQQVIKNGEETMQTGILVETPYRIISKKGKLKYFRSSGSFTERYSNNILIGTVQDISKDVESAEELQSINLTLKNTNEELKSFNYIASHDLKEPLRKIQTFSKLIMETETFSDKTQDYFNRVISAGQHMQNLLDSLLNFSFVSSTKLIFNPCDLNIIIEECKDGLQINITETKAIIEYENLPTINGLHVQLSQLFTNLIDNAIKYSKPQINPLIKITSSIVRGKQMEHNLANRLQQYHAIAISDNGIGFETEYENKIFELFQRLHARNQYRGTGVGLAIVKKIATNHNGFIIAEGKPGIGSTFTLYIPTE